MQTTQDIQNETVIISVPEQQISVQEFCKANNFIQIGNHVRVNQNGYPYVTFINKDNRAENVYFSKKASETVGEGKAIQAGFFKPFNINPTVNETGEVRIKLGLIGESTRVDIADLF